MRQLPSALWCVSATEMLQQLQATPEGLTSAACDQLRAQSSKTPKEIGFNASIILKIVLASGLLGFWQERSATSAVEKLLAIVQIKAAVLVKGAQQKFPSRRLFRETSSF